MKRTWTRTLGWLLLFLLLTLLAIVMWQRQRRLARNDSTADTTCLAARIGLPCDGGGGH